MMNRDKILPGVGATPAFLLLCFGKDEKDKFVAMILPAQVRNQFDCKALNCTDVIIVNENFVYPTLGMVFAGADV